MFLSEQLDGLIIFSNTSDNFIAIKELYISIIIKSKPDYKVKKIDIKIIFRSYSNKTKTNSYCKNEHTFRIYF